MRILLHALNFAPEELGCGKYSGEMVRDLVAAGHRCAVVTTPPYYPQWRIWEGYNGWAYRRDVLDWEGQDAVEVVRCPLWAPKKVTGLKRVLHLASFGLSSVPAVLWKAMWFRPDVIVTVEPTAFCMPTTWLAARLTGAKAWIHVQDFEVDAAFDLGILKNKLLRRAILAGESFLMRRFDRASTISPNMLKKLIQKGVSEERAMLFPNWVDCEEMKPLWEPALTQPSQDGNGGQAKVGASSRRRFGIPEEAFVALYAGSIGDKQGLEILTEAAQRLRGETRLPIRIVICGNGSGQASLLELSRGLDNLQMLPVQPFECFNELMNCADVHLLPQKAGAADLVMPSKLTGMLATGRPVLACAAEGTQIAAVVSECGIVVPPGEATPFAEAIRTLAADPALCRSLGKKARQYALDHMSRQVILERFRRELSMLTTKVAAKAAPALDDPASVGPAEGAAMISPSEGVVNRPHFGGVEIPSKTGDPSNG